MSRHQLIRLVAVAALAAACTAQTGAVVGDPIKAVHPERDEIVYHRVRPAVVTGAGGAGPIKAVHPDRCEIVYHRVRPAGVSGAVGRPTGACAVQPSPDH